MGSCDYIYRVVDFFDGYLIHLKIIMSDEKQIIICEHCGNKTPHEVIFNVSGPDEIIDLGDGHEFGVATFYFVAKCNVCSEISFYTDWEESGNLGQLSEAVLLYPTKNKLDKIVPEPIIKDYEEAKKVIKKSPIAFAVLVRRALENVCINKSAVGKNLKQKLDDLGKKGVIPESLSKMADAIRYLGNAGAHAGGEDIDDEEAKILDDFVRAIIEYVYVAPDKLNKLANKISKKKNHIENKK